MPLEALQEQLTRTQQFLRSLEQDPSASTQLLTTLQLELSNIQDIYKSSETTITSAINLINSNHTPSPNAKEACYPSWELPSVGSQEQPQLKIYAASRQGLTNLLQHNLHNTIP